MSKVRPCISCGRPTRPPRGLIADYPGTVYRCGEQCKTCYDTVALPRDGRHPLAYTRAGLASFLRRRHKRAHTQARANYLATYLERMSA